MSRTGLSPSDIAESFRDRCGDGSVEWVYTPTQTWVLLDAADMLDERGVEHYDGTETTLWGYEQTSESAGTYRFSADELSDGLVNVWLHHRTPEQAVEATLGRGTCEVECFDDGMDEGMDGGTFSYAPPTWYLSCGHEVYGSERPHYCSTCGRRVVEP